MGLCICMEESAEFGCYLFYIRRRKYGLKNDGRRARARDPAAGKVITKSDVDKAGGGESRAFFSSSGARDEKEYIACLCRPRLPDSCVPWPGCAPRAGRAGRRQDEHV